MYIIFLAIIDKSESVLLQILCVALRDQDWKSVRSGRVSNSLQCMCDFSREKAS